MSQPFTGVRILDFTQVFAGPFGSYQLALLGADVDQDRAARRRRHALRAAEQGVVGQGPRHRLDGDQLEQAQHRARSDEPEAIAIVKRLAETADVVMENYRPGVMEKLGIGYAALSAVNPRLI